jgi:hypothetical protein
MTPWMWVVLIVVVLAVIALAGTAASRRRTTSLQRRFGPEYDQTVAASDDRRAAEAELQERARKRAQLRIVPLSEPERLRYAEQWRAVQERFVDQPSEAVISAERLLNGVMELRGYPVEDFEEQASLVSVDHPGMVQDYRTAHGIYQRNLSREATTEELREALLRYRSLFDDLLRPGPEPDLRTDGGPDHQPAHGRAFGRVDR